MEPSTYYAAAKLAYANKTKEFITSQKLGSYDFLQFANIVFSKVKSDIPPLLNSPEVVSSVSDKTKLMAKKFSENFDFDYAGVFLLAFLLELI